MSTASVSAPSPTPIDDLIIVASGVGKSFPTRRGSVLACQNIDLGVAAGEFVVIVGPSGCGKSTFLRLVAGLDHPTAGSLRIQQSDGHQATNAMVFHGHTLYPWLTLRQNVSFGMKLAGWPGDARRERARELLNLVGLAEHVDRYPNQVSEGMRQRTSIARALAMDPHILLMDEPFGALDEQTRYILQAELLRIWEQTGKTIIFVTHSIDEALLLADRVIVMSAQPGTMVDEIAVPFARPRSMAKMHADPQFAPLFDRIWARLQAEVSRGGAFA